MPLHIVAVIIIIIIIFIITGNLIIITLGHKLKFDTSRLTTVHWLSMSPGIFIIINLNFICRALLKT